MALRSLASLVPFVTILLGKSSDNTFDRLPPELNGATSLITRRLSDPTLKPRDPALATASEELAAALKKAGFTRAAQPVVWRNHDLLLTDAALWSRPVALGKEISLPGFILDYAVLFTEPTRP